MRSVVARLGRTGSKVATATFGAGFLAAALAAPGAVGAHPEASSTTDVASFPISEGSGLVASARYPGVVWGLGDGGQGNSIYAFVLRDGQLEELSPGVSFRRFEVPGTTNVDWEDLGLDDEGNLWIGDFGNNGCSRSDLRFYRVVEPDPYAGSDDGRDDDRDDDDRGDDDDRRRGGGDGRDGTAQLAATHRFTWPDHKPGCSGTNAEGMFIVDGQPYVLSKVGRPAIYRLATLDPTASVPLVKVADLALPPEGFDKLPTGAAVSADRTRLAVTTAAYQAWVYEADTSLLAGDALVAALAAQPPRWTQLYRPDHANVQVEAATFSGCGNDLLLLAEGRQLLEMTAPAYEASAVVSLGAPVPVAIPAPAPPVVLPVAPAGTGAEGPPVVSVGDVTVREGVPASVVVTLSRPARAPVTVGYATCDATAHAPSDYAPARGTVTFAPGQVAAAVALPTAVADATAEGAESFGLRLWGTGGATVARSLAIVTVAD